MAFWTSTFLTKARNRLCSSISQVTYKVGATWHAADLNNLTVSGTTVIVLVSIPKVPAGANTITGIRLYDAGGEIAGEQTCNIVRTATQNVLLKFEFPLTEV